MAGLDEPKGNSGIEAVRKPQEPFVAEESANSLKSDIKKHLRPFLLGLTEGEEASRVLDGMVESLTEDTRKALHAAYNQGYNAGHGKGTTEAINRRSY